VEHFDEVLHVDLDELPEVVADIEDWDMVVGIVGPEGQDDELVAVVEHGEHLHDELHVAVELEDYALHLDEDEPLDVAVADIEDLGELHDDHLQQDAPHDVVDNVDLHGELVAVVEHGEHLDDELHADLDELHDVVVDSEDLDGEESHVVVADTVVHEVQDDELHLDVEHFDDVFHEVVVDIEDCNEDHRDVVVGIVGHEGQGDELHVGLDELPDAADNGVRDNEDQHGELRERLDSDVVDVPSRRDEV
jgi:hypothetical protein